MNRIPASVITGLVISTLICFALPVGGFVWSRKRYGKTVRPFFFGMLAFFVSQVVLRAPILALLSRFSWFLAFGSRFYVYALFLAVTAGLFEETARYAAVRFFLKKNRGFGDAVAFGFGHGGLEAILLAGASFAVYTVLSLAINAGSYQVLLASVSQVQRDAISMTLYNLTLPGTLLGAAERIFAVTAHIGMTVMIFRGFAFGRPGRGLLCAIAAHTVIDFTALALQNLGVGSLAVEGVLAVLAVGFMMFSLWAKSHTPWRKEGDTFEKSSGSVPDSCD